MESRPGDEAEGDVKGTRKNSEKVAVSELVLMDKRSQLHQR